MKLLFVLVFIVTFSAFCTRHWEDAPNHMNDSGKLLSDWIAVQLRLIRNTTGVPHVAYSRHFSYTSIAFYEAMVTGCPPNHSITGELNGQINMPVAPVSRKFCWASSANAAYAAMMRVYYTGNKINAPIIDSMENAWNVIYQTAGYTPDEISKGADYGKAISASIVNWSLGDGSDKAGDPYTPPVGDGLWVPTPPAFAKPAAPYWGNNRTLVSNNIDYAMPQAPLAFSKETTSPFYKIVKELYDTSQTLSQSEKDIASFWDDSPNGKYVTAYGHWASICAQLIMQRKLSLVDGAKAFAKMSIAMSDASIACWKAKYKYNQLRPVTYIQNYIAARWQSFVVTPPHPEYPAAHSTLSYAAATALSAALGNDFSFYDHTYDFLGVTTPYFANISSAAKQAGVSRLYGGIHFTPSINAGAASGKKTADYILVHLKFN